VQIIFSYFWRLCLLKADPMHLPERTVVLAVLFSSYALVALCAGIINYPTRTSAEVVLILSVGLFVQLTLLYGILRFKGAHQHYTRAVGSLLGTSALMTLILLPVNLILLKSELEWLRAVADSLTWIWLAWWLLIGGNILAKVARLSLAQGAILIFVTELLSTLASLHWVGEL
jgi:hypothetical protein